MDFWKNPILEHVQKSIGKILQMLLCKTFQI
jgi:hypothetical protein